MTWGQIARFFEPSLTDEQIDYLLWNETAFPHSDFLYTYKQLRSAIRAFRNGIQRCECCGAKEPIHHKKCYYISQHEDIQLGVIGEAPNISNPPQIQ